MTQSSLRYLQPLGHRSLYRRGRRHLILRAWEMSGAPLWVLLSIVAITDQDLGRCGQETRKSKWGSKMRGMFWLGLFFWFCWLAAGSIANSAEISAVNGKHGWCAGQKILTITGLIAPGDSEKIIKLSGNGHEFCPMIYINSAGGNVNEAARIADAIHVAKMGIAVVGRPGHPAQCASACFYLFAAAEYRFVFSEAAIGVHRIREANGTETVGTRNSDTLVAQVLSDYGVPPVVIGKMIACAPSAICWLKWEDIAQMEHTFYADPVEVTR